MTDRDARWGGGGGQSRVVRGRAQYGMEVGACRAEWCGAGHNTEWKCMAGQGRVG